MANSTPEWADKFKQGQRMSPFKLDDKTILLVTAGRRNPTDFECILATSTQYSYRYRPPRKANEPLITLEKLCQAKIMQRLICEIYNYPPADVWANHPRTKIGIISAMQALVHPLNYVTEKEFKQICESYQDILNKCPDKTATFPTLNDQNRFLPIKLKREPEKQE